MIPYIFFDLDGTLTDPGEGITNSAAYALERFGIFVEDRRVLYPFIGPPLDSSFMQYFGFSEKDAERAVVYFREYFRDRGIFENKVYPGVPELLAGLRDRGQFPVLATSKPEEFARRVLEHFGLMPYFRRVAGASMDRSRVEKSDVIRYATQLCGSPEPSEILMVGDRKHDILGAKDNGLQSLGVLYGYGDREELLSAGADFLAETPEEVLRICGTL